MIHDFTGSAVTERSPRIMRKKSRPLSIIDENLEDWTRGIQADETLGGLKNGIFGDTIVKNTTDDALNGNSSVNDSKCVKDTFNEVTEDSKSESVPTVTCDNNGIASDSTAESSPPEGERRRRSSLRRLAVAPLEHPVFALTQGGCLDNEMHKALNADQSKEKSSPEADANQTNMTYNDTNHSLSEVSSPASETNQISQDDVISSDESDLDLDIGCQATACVEESAWSKGEHVHSNDSSFAEGDENNSVRILQSCIHEQFSDAVDSDEGYSDFQRDHGNAQEGSQIVFYENPTGHVSDKGIATNRIVSPTSKHINKLDKMDTSVSSNEDKNSTNGTPGTEKGGDLDKEQMAWKNRVRQSFSFTHMSNKFRPIRRSMSSDYNWAAPTVDSERSGDISRKYSDTVKFYISDGSPRLQRKDETVLGRAPETCSPLGSPTNRRHISAQSLPRTRKSSWQDFRSGSKSHDFDSHSRFRRTSLDHTKPMCSGMNFETFSKWMKSRDKTNQSIPHPQSRTNQQLVTEKNQQDNQSNAPPIRRISAIDQSDFSLLKDTATRLNLPTRRPSTMAWRAQYVDNQSFLTNPSILKDNKSGNNVEDNDASNADSDVPLTVERKNRINESLSWLRQELINIRLQDQALARQFLGIRHTMNKLRLAAECEGHKELLDNAEEDMEELRELSRLVDVPTELLSPLTPLQHLGVTRMNLTSRRFSTC